jgi:hypothetical protein
MLIVWKKYLSDKEAKKNLMENYFKWMSGKLWENMCLYNVRFPRIFIWFGDIISVDGFSWPFQIEISTALLNFAWRINLHTTLLRLCESWSGFLELSAHPFG